MRRRRLWVAVGAASLLLTLPGVARASCDEPSARDRLAVLKDVLQRSDSLAAIDAAKADFAADGHFDNPHNARVFAAAMAYFKVERQLDDGRIAEACAFLARAKRLIDEVVLTHDPPGDVQSGQ